MNNPRTTQRAGATASGGSVEPMDEDVEVRIGEPVSEETRAGIAQATSYSGEGVRIPEEGSGGSVEAGVETLREGLRAELNGAQRVLDSFGTRKPNHPDDLGRLMAAQGAHNKAAAMLRALTNLTDRIGTLERELDSARGRVDECQRYHEPASIAANAQARIAELEQKLHESSTATKRQKQRRMQSDKAREAQHEGLAALRDRIHYLEGRVGELDAKAAFADRAYAIGFFDFNEYVRSVRAALTPPTKGPNDE